MIVKVVRTEKAAMINKLLVFLFFLLTIVLWASAILLLIGYKKELANIWVPAFMVFYPTGGMYIFYGFNIYPCRKIIFITGQEEEEQ